nr:protein unc 45 A [Hymenolepis microstoma]
MVEICEELHKKGNSFFSEGKYQQAIDSYKECLKNSSDDRKRQQVVNRNLAQCYLNLNKYNEAVQTASEALKICPTDTKALFRRSVAFEKQGELKESIEDAKMLIQLEPNNKSIQDLIRRVESYIIEKKDFAQSLKGKVDSMYFILTDDKSDDDLIGKALSNMIALVKDEGKTAANTLWSHPSCQKLFDLTNSNKTNIVTTTLLLLEKIVKAVPSLGVIVIDRLTNKYIFGRVLSSNVDVSVEMCKFISHILESITEIKSYKKAHDAAFEAAKRDKTQAQTFLPKEIYPAYRLDPALEGRVQELLTQIMRASNSYRLEAAARDVLIQTLTWLIPCETGIGWSKRFINAEGNIERLLEVAAATCPATAIDRGNPNLSSSRRKRLADETSQVEKEAGLPEISRGGLLKTSHNTRLIVACLLSRLFNDLRSDQDRQHFCQVCVDFVMELLTDKFIESKIEAAAIIGTLFSGPYEIGSRVLGTEGILEGLFLLTQSENLAHQTVALDTIILATTKKDKCMAIVNQAVPILRALYKSPDDGIKVRALLGLCKLGVLGGSDASIKSMADGSTVILMKACRRLLLGESSNALRDDPNSTRWAIDGLAYLSLTGEVKEAVTKDKVLLEAVFKVADLGYYDTAFPLVSFLANLTNSFPEKEVLPEMVEIAKFAKQHIPEKHEQDEPKVVAQRRKTLIDIGLPSCLFNITTKLVTKTSASQPHVREMVSRIYLSCAECIDCRGVLVAAGAGKALLNLALSENTDEGKYAASQALAKLSITADPRLTFPGERSLEVIRPLLQLLDMECPALQNFEGLLSLTNLASLDDKHRSRMLAEGVLPKIEHYMFEEHEDLRRAAVECFGNLAQHPAVVLAYGGEGDPEDKTNGSSETILAKCGSSGSEVIKLLTLYCYDEKDIFLVRAAAGALAVLSHDIGILKRITQVDKWKEKFEALVAHPSPAIQHRAAYILRNCIVVGGADISLDIVQTSKIVELLDYLLHLPDITDSEPLNPEVIVLGQGRPKELIREEAKSDRIKSRELAEITLKKLVEYGYIKPTPK